jgi:conjugal transfer pilus assembly protein TraF
MSLRPDSPDAVEAAQRYMKWVVSKASQAANMWYFNMVQHPDLDPTVKNPISEVGLALATKVDQASSKEYLQLIKSEGGVLFYITRNDCAYCHDQVAATRRVAYKMGLTLINVPIDHICLAGFEGETCGDTVPTEAIAQLNVQIVPALYLYVPESTWIRLASGVSDDQTIMANTVNFFSAYRAAMLNGLDNSRGSRPSVTFDPDLRPRATGTVAADGSAPQAAPDRAEMLKLLGFKPVDEKP